MHDNGRFSVQIQIPHPAVTTDSVVFGFDGRKLHILLIERGIEPFKGMWALPGGFLKIDETADQCAMRELMEETGVADVNLEQFHTFSDLLRDPRERVLTVAYFALVRKSDYRLIAGDDAARASWFEIDEPPRLRPHRNHQRSTPPHPVSAPQPPHRLQAPRREILNRRTTASLRSHQRHRVRPPQLCQEDGIHRPPPQRRPQQRALPQPSRQPLLPR